MPSLSGSKAATHKRPPMSKIRSWSAGLGAKLGSSSSNDKQDLASEVELRKKGIDNLYTSTEAYWSYLGKKKPVPFDTSTLPVDDTSSITIGTVTSNPEGKMLPVEAMGWAMSSFSTAFPDGSAYGSCLGLLGEAHIKLGYLQSTFTKDTSHIFLARIARSKAALDSFTAALKKLGSATARLESAQSKVQKRRKEKRELEEELRLAKAAYDEAVTDVEARAEAIQDAEYDDWQCLTTYMQAQVDYTAQATAVLEQVKSMWGQPPPSRANSGANTPVTRPRSLSGPGAPKLRPSISRRSSAKDGGKFATAASSRFGSRSSLSLSNIDRPSSPTDETKREKEKDKKSRLRMPSFTGTGDTVASVASGIGSFGRAKSSSLFGNGSTGANGEGSPSPEKEREGPSKWNFKTRSKKEYGFMSMDEAEKTAFESNGAGSRPPALPARDYVRQPVSAHDVHLGGDLDGSVDGHGDASPNFRLSCADDDSDDEEFSAGHEPSPFSPDPDSQNFLNASKRRSVHDTIHERGESQLSSEIHIMDSGFHGTSSAPHQAHLSLSHTGLSAYSDGGDPFCNASSAMSPQATGGRFNDDSTDEEQERQGLTAGNLVDSTGERRGVEPSASWKNLAAGMLNGIGNGNGGGNARGPPPPIPSSASFLSKSKARLAPPPPPLPSRNSQ